MSKSETNPNQEAQDESSDVLDVALKAKELQKVWKRDAKTEF